MNKRSVPAPYIQRAVGVMNLCGLVIADSAFPRLRLYNPVANCKPKRSSEVFFIRKIEYGLDALLPDAPNKLVSVG